jgi:hypothetical protein
METRTQTIHVGGCEGSCGGWYFCAGCFQVVGWCNGAGDDMPDHCDDCWAAFHRCEDGPEPSQGATP